jgi:hypothetical protein
MRIGLYDAILGVAKITHAMWKLLNTLKKGPEFFN